MKNLMLMRHAKSSWNYDISDQYRQLKERGINDAIRMGEFLSDYILQPEKIYSSFATRALETCTIIANKINYPIEQVSITKLLYDFSGNTVVQFIKKLSDLYQSVMLFGHNNAFTTLANALGNKTISTLPTAGVVVIVFEVNCWKNIEKGKTILVKHPKLLK